MAFANQPAHVDLTSSLGVGEVAVGTRPTTPTRLTLSTPSELARFSLGAAKGTGINDIEPGLTGRTNNHASTFITAPADQLCTTSWTTTAELEGLTPTGARTPRTLVSEGIPSRLDPHATAAAGQWPSALKTKVAADTAATVGGHCVYTTGCALQYAVGDCRMVSVSGNALVRSVGDNETNWAALHADHGQASVYAKHDIWIGSGRTVHIGATGSAPLPTPGQPFQYSESIASLPANGAWASQFLSIVNTVVGAGVTLASVAVTLYRAKFLKFEAMPGLQTWAPKPSAGSKAVMALLGLAAKGADIFAGMGGWANNIAMYADKDIVAMGGMSASIYGNTGASLSSLLNASVSALYTTVSGAMFAGLSAGIGASVGALKDVDVEAQFGKAMLRGGYKGVEVSSPYGQAVIAGQLNTEVKSVLGRASVVGGKGALLAAGVGTGWGVQVQPTAVTIGAVPSINPFSAAYTADIPAIFKIGLTGAKISVASVSKIEALPAGVTVQSPMTTIKGDALVKVDAPLIQVG